MQLKHWFIILTFIVSTISCSEEKDELGSPTTPTIETITGNWVSASGALLTFNSNGNYSIDWKDDELNEVGLWELRNDTLISSTSEEKYKQLIVHFDGQNLVLKTGDAFEEKYSKVVGD